MSFFVTGTDTGCGKTLVTSALLESYRALGVPAVGMKPVATGAEYRGGRLHNEDVAALAAASGVPVPDACRSPYVFRPPCSPHLAAGLAGIPIDLARLRRAYDACAARAEVVAVEGVGGWCVPLGPGQQVQEMTLRLGLPVLLVVGVRLGCINHALLTVRAIAASGATLAGWVANLVEQDMLFVDAVVDTLTAQIPAPLLGVVPWGSRPQAASLAGALTGAARTLAGQTGR